jgi:hypothetical protein
MPSEVIYRDLPQFGMKFVTPEDPGFGELANQISLDPLGTKLEETPSDAVVLLNQSGKIALVISALWKWAGDGGQITQQRMTGLHSLDQLDWHTEQTKQMPIWFHPFLAGSKRLITTHGVFGDNSDVLPPEARPKSFAGSWAGFHRRARTQRKPSLLEVTLDSVIFADGLCAGPDDMRLFETIGPVAAEQHRIASEAVTLLRDGAPIGELFDLVRSTARPPGPSQAPQVADPLHLLFSFGRQAVDHLVRVGNDHRDDLIFWFQAQSEQPRLKLHRPD